MNCQQCVFEDYNSRVDGYCSFCSRGNNPHNKIVLTRNEDGIHHPVASGFSEEEAKTLVSNARNNGAVVNLVCWSDSTAAFVSPENWET